MDYAPIERFALRHHGIVSTEIFVELGGTRSGWRWALESGRLHAVHPGVARFPGAPLTTDAQILAAVWASGPAALASHRAAAEVWCPVSALALVDVVVPRRYRRRPLRGVLIHRPRDDADLRPSLWRNIPVTNPLRTLVDLGAVDPDGVRGCLERMVIAGFVSPAAVRAALDRHARPGRAGVTALRVVLDDWTMNERPPDSVLEEAMTRLVMRFSLPQLVFHPRLVGYEVDFLVAGSCIVVECDGWATHGLMRSTFESDRVRDNDLAAAGYVVRFTWRQICRQPASVARRLRAVIARHEPDLLIRRRALGTAGA